MWKLNNILLNNHWVKEKIKREVPYDPAIPLMNLYPAKTKTLTHTDTCIPMFSNICNT